MSAWILILSIICPILVQAEVRTTTQSCFQPDSITASNHPRQTLTASITSRTALELRAASTICGYWSSIGITHTIQCDAGIPCVFSSIAPNSIFGFCTHSGVQIITTGYDYGAYPAGGCQPGQLCCNSALPHYGEYVFNGISSFFDCATSRFYLAAVTAITASTTSSSSSSSTTTSSTNPTTSSTSSPNPSTASSGTGASTSGSTANSGNAADGSTPASSNSAKLSIGAIVGIVSGALGVIVLIAIGIFCFLKRRQRNKQEDVFLQMHPSTDGEAPPYHQNPRYYDDPVYHNTVQKAS